MKPHRINIERVVSIVAFFYLGLAFCGAMTLNGDEHSILPHSKFIICFTHAICALLCLFCIFKPVVGIQIVILLTESFVTILTNYEILGIFFFYFAIILLLCKGHFTKKVNIQAIILFIFHLINILLMYTHGWERTLIAMATSIFSITFFMWIYSMLKAKLSCLFPTTVTNNTAISSKRPGTELSLSEYNLTERQKNLIMDYLHNNLSYNDLSDKYNISLSTVKKDFADTFKIFNVNKLEELHILLLQYRVTK